MTSTVPFYSNKMAIVSLSLEVISCTSFNFRIKTRFVTKGSHNYTWLMNCHCPGACHHEICLGLYGV